MNNHLDQTQRLFFIALLPPQEIQDTITELKQDFATRYNSRHALTSPPHITLQPPFRWSMEQIPILEQTLSQFANTHVPLSIKLSNFGAFPPRVIYVNVIKMAGLMGIYQDLRAYLETTLQIVDPDSKNRSFSPHVTVAFRDLTQANFKAAWSEFKHKTINFEFTVSQLTLLIHQNHQWAIKAEFPFLSN